MLSVLIVNWNTREPLRSCLDSIYRFPPEEPFEVIVVDNASSDGSADMVETMFVAVTLIKSTVNLGYASGNNLAFSHANGDLLLTLNPDTEFTDDALKKAVDIFCKSPEFGCLAIRLINPDGIAQKSVRGFPTLVGVFGALTGLDRLLPRSALGSYTLPAFDYALRQPAPQPMGTFLLFRREALQAVGDPRAPLDERFPIFFNEVDLLYRMSRAGLPCLYDPTVSVVHLHGASTSQVRPQMVWESHKSLVRYFSKHLRGPKRLALPFVAAASYLAAFIRARGYHAGFRPHDHDLQLEHDR